MRGGRSIALAVLVAHLRLEGDPASLALLPRWFLVSVVPFPLGMLGIFVCERLPTVQQFFGCGPPRALQQCAVSAAAADKPAPPSSKPPPPPPPAGGEAAAEAEPQKKKGFGGLFGRKK